MRFGERLHAERKKLKLSAEELGVLCGVSRSYITLIETGKRLPGKKIIPILAQALNLKTHVIVNWYLEELRRKFK